jgi:hypothetical protein
MIKQNRVTGTSSLRALQLMAALGSVACGSTGLPTELSGSADQSHLSDPVLVAGGTGAPVRAVDGGTAAAAGGAARNGQGGAGGTRGPVAGSGGVTTQPMRPDAGVGLPPPMVTRPPVLPDGGVPGDVQPCLTSDTFDGLVTIQSRDDIARFKACRQIAGDLFIVTLTLEDLHGLEGLQVIYGQLVIAPALPGNPDPALSAKSALTTLSGLEGLTSVGGLDLEYLSVPTLAPLARLQSAPNVKLVELNALKDLTGLQNAGWTSAVISDNAQLQSLNGLNSPTGALTVELSRDPKLQDLTALSGMQSVGELTLSDLPALSTLAGLKSLMNATVLSVDGCSGLSDLSGLGSLGSIGAVTLSNNASLQTLMGLSTQHMSLLSVSNCPKLQNLKGAMGSDGTGPDSLQLSSLPALKSLAGLENARTSQLVQIDQCDALVDLSGLDQLQTVSSLMITNCSHLQNLKGAGELKTIDQVFSLDRLPALSSVAGMSKLAQVTSLEVSMTNVLPNFAGFDALVSLSGLYAASNAALQNLKGLEHLVAIDAVILENNPSLQSLDGFPMLDHLTSLDLEANPLLSSVSALGSYKAIDALTVNSSGSLTGFDGLDQLGTIAGTLNVVGNSSLSSLHGLKSLTKVGTLAFQSNERLSQCELNWLTQQTHSPAIMGDGPQGPCP